MIGFAFIIVKICIQVIWKEEYSQHHEHDEEFYKYNQPECFPNCHIAKTIPIKYIQVLYNLWCLHVEINAII
jgi:hypothetical protein